MLVNIHTLFYVQCCFLEDLILRLKSPISMAKVHVHIFKDIHLSTKVSGPILITFHVKGHYRLHKVFGLIGLKLWLQWQHIASIDLY